MHNPLIYSEKRAARGLPRGSRDAPLLRSRGRFLFLPLAPPDTRALRICINLGNAREPRNRKPCAERASFRAVFTIAREPARRVRQEDAFYGE